LRAAAEAVGAGRPVPGALAGRAFGLALAVIGVLCFSVRPVLVKLAYRWDPDPVTLLALRMGFALPFFVLAAALAGRRQIVAPIAPRDGLALLGLGFTGYYLASYLDFLGLQYISAGLGRLILFLYPTIVVVLSIACFGTRARRREVVALAVSYAGLALALLNRGGDSPNLMLGAALVFASGVLYAIYLVGGGEIVKRVGSIRFSAYATSVACVLCILQFLLLRPLSALDQPWQIYAIGAVIAIFCTVLPVFMTAEALRRIGSNTVAVLGALGPISALFWSWVGLDERVTPLQLVGAALVISGVLLVSVRGREA